MRVLKILYVDNSIEDPKLTAHRLENDTKIFQEDIGVLVFTVVSNKFTGLEFTRSICFDCIIVDDGDKEDVSLSSYEFFVALASVGVKIPIGKSIS